MSIVNDGKRMDFVQKLWMTGLKERIAGSSQLFF